MKRLFLISFILLFLTNCAEKQQIIKNSLLLQAATPVKSEPSHPKDFEKSIPESSMIRNSLVSFKKSYQKVYSDSGVNDIAAGKYMISALKDNEIGFTMPYCSGLSLKEKYDRVRVYGYEAVIYNGSYMDVYSAKECASVGVYKRILNGGVEIVPNYIIEWFSSQAVLRNSYNGEILYKGDTGIPVVSAGFIAGKPALLQNNGYLLIYNEKLKSFVIYAQLPSGYNEIYHQEGIFYGTLKDNNKFFVLDNDSLKVSEEINCKVSSHSIAAICGNTLITDIEKYHDLPKAKDFAATSTSYLTLDNKNLQIYYLETLWQRYLSFNFAAPKACVKNKDIYYKSFSGKIYKQSKGIEEEVPSFPKNCNYKNIVLNYGEFHCGSKVCGKYSSPIKNNHQAVMYRRIEDNTVYYYFDNLE